MHIVCLSHLSPSSPVLQSDNIKHTFDYQERKIRSFQVNFRLALYNTRILLEGGLSMEQKKHYRHELKYMIPYADYLAMRKRLAVFYGYSYGYFISCC